MRIYLLVSIILLSIVASAQPQPFGCHHFRNLGGKQHTLTQRERELINESIARSDTFDIHHYHVAIDVTDYAGQSIKAATYITVSAKMAAQNFIRFDLKQLVVDSVKAGDALLNFNQEGDFLKVWFQSPPAVNEVMDIAVWYHGNPYKDPQWGGFYFASNYIYNLGIGLTTIPPNFGKVWYPCFDSFVERATYSYDIKSAGTFRAYCQGDFLGEVALGGDTVIRSFAFTQPIPTHLSAIAVADYTSTEYEHSGIYGPVPVTLTSKPANHAGMLNVFQHLGYAIDACEYWYGPYPFSRVGYVLTTAGALEIPTNVAYPQFMTGQSLAANGGLFSHELGHHWWGDMVTPHNHNDMWMKEGPAEYSSHLFVELKDGQEEFIETVKDNLLYVLESAHVEDGGFQPLSPMPDEHIYGIHTYYKGASVMHNLRGYMGDELFRQAMTGVQNNYAYKDLTPEQLRDALEEQSGYELNPFFEDQIFSPGFATFVVDSFTAAPAGNMWNLTVHIKQKLRACPHFHTQVPLDFTAVNEDLSSFDTQVVASGEYTTVTVQCPFSPVMVVLNRHQRLNQNRMDLEKIISPTQPLGPVLPWVDFKLYDDVITDTTLVRIEHVWSAPDAENLGPGIYQISNTHYWHIDGMWPEGTQLRGRVNYRAVDATDLDFDLYNATEADAVLLYRSSAAEPFQVYPHFTLNAGNLFNGTGNINIDVLKKGDYCFANGDASVAVDKPATPDELRVYPIPANNELQISGRAAGTALLEVRDMEGRLLIRSSESASGDFRKSVDVSWLPSGLYHLRVIDLERKISLSKQFSVIH